MKTAVAFVLAALSAQAAVPPYDGKNFVPEVSGEKTGFFHTLKSEDGKWWVIDPLGRGFGVFGVDHIRMNGHYTWQGETWPQQKANERKYGSRPAWEKATIERLNDWGFTLLGAGSEKQLRHRGLVHTDFLAMGADFCDYSRDSYISVYEHRPCSGFPNVFHPDFPKFCAARAAKICTPQKDDPWLFGYFIDNELCWWGSGWFDDGLYNCAKALPATHSARQALEAYLKQAGATQGEPSVAVKRGFTRLCAEKYFSIASAAIRKVDPNHLVLGCRFAWPGGPHIWAEAGKYCDVLTVNCYADADLDANVIRYQGSTLAKVYNEYYGYAQKPMIVTEWSFPALDSGLPCTDGAGQRFRTQAGRTRATKLFAQTLLSLPFIVGYDYFMWSDEPATGIGCHFPENTNYGLTDNNGDAYPEITAMFTDLQKNVWRERSRPTPAEGKVAKLQPVTAERMLRVLGVGATVDAAGQNVDAAGQNVDAASRRVTQEGRRPQMTRRDAASTVGISVPTGLVKSCATNGSRVVTNPAGLSLAFEGVGDTASSRGCGVSPHRECKSPALVKISIDGEYCGLLRLARDGTLKGKWTSIDLCELENFRFRNEGANGIVEADAVGADGLRLGVRITVYPNELPFLVELTGVRGGADGISPVRHVVCHVDSPFIDYVLPDSIRQLWKSPPYQSWFGADGKRLGAVSLAPCTGSIKFRRELRENRYAGLVEWWLPKEVAPGKTVAPVDGCYALIVPGRGGRKAWKKFVAPLKPSVDETGLDTSPAGYGWPLVTMRQMSSTSYDEKTMKELIAIHSKYPGGCGEIWLAENYPRVLTSMVARATALGDLAPRIRAAGMRVGFQQGVTLGHDFSTCPEGGRLFPEDAYQVDVDGKKTAFLCPTSPDVLKCEEEYAETYVREGLLESYWLDDDLRLGFCKNRAAGCWCDRCLKKLNAKAGTNLTRSAFIARLDADVAEEPLRAVWTDFKAESLAGFAAAARRGAKRANPDVRMGYQAIGSWTLDSGADNRAILAALSDDFKDTVGIRPGHGFYAEAGCRTELPWKLIGVAREAERCRAIPGWKGSIAYEQENYPHYAAEKTVELALKECAAGLAVGCDAVTEYWQSSAVPEPLDHYEDFVRLTQAWSPYLKRLAEISRVTHLGGVAHRVDPKLLVSKANTVKASLTNVGPRADKADVSLALLGVPVTVEEAGTKSFYDPRRVPDPTYTTTARRAAFLDELDKLPGGPVCVRVDKVHPVLVWPRVDGKGRTVAVTFFNLAMGAALRLPVRVRRPGAREATLVRPTVADEPLALADGEGDEVRFTLPDLPAAAMCTVVF